MSNIGNLDAGIRRVADQLIRDAIAEGDIDPRTLPGFGQPIPGIDEPYDDHWWVRRWVKREGLSSTLPVLTPTPNLRPARTRTAEDRD